MTNECERRINWLLQARVVRVFDGIGQTKYAAALPTARDMPDDFAGPRKISTRSLGWWRGFGSE